MTGSRLNDAVKVLRNKSKNKSVVLSRFVGVSKSLCQNRMTGTASRRSSSTTSKKKLVDSIGTSKRDDVSVMD